jgi:hypothetical protein
MSTKKKLTVAFRNLRKAGYFAEARFGCCQGCGWAAVPDEMCDNAVFYHEQDAEELKYVGHVHLAWSGNGAEIMRHLRDAGLYVDWDGDPAKRICVGEVPFTRQ